MTVAASPRVSLRPATRSDRARVEAITRAVGLFRDDEVAVALEVFDAAVGGDTSYTTFVAADERDEAAGWICWGPTPCTLGTFDMYWVAVDPAAQAAGVGTRLVDEMERRLPSTARMIIVETAGRPDYAGTRAFYLARGYRQAAVIPDFYAPGDDKVVFLKLCTPIADS